MPVLTRTLKMLPSPSVGADVEAWARGAHRYLADGQLDAFEKQKPIIRRTFGTGKRTLAKQCAKKAGLEQYGVVGPALDAAMRKAGAYDAYADLLFAEYAHDLEPKPVLIEPRQGFQSLDKSLWPTYSIGRSRYGLTDLGTYNPASKLPSGAPSDHAVYPACAFDLGIEPDIGWNNLKARAFAVEIVGRPEINYVILGDRIWTTRRKFWGAYFNGGHMNHVHVSGYR